MITDDKIREIRKKIQADAPEGEIKEELIKSGYSNEDITKIFTPRHYDMRSWYLLFGIILFFVGLSLYLSRQILLGFVLSGLLFIQYYRETERLKKVKKSDGDTL